MIETGNLTENSHVVTDHVRVLLEKAQSVGVSPNALLQRCHLSFGLEHLASYNVSYLPINQFVLLREVCIDAIRRALAVSDEGGMALAEFRLMCHGLISSSTLREAMERVTQFLALGEARFGWGRLRVEEKEAAFEIGLGTLESRWEEFFTINALVLFKRLFDWLIGEPLDAQFFVRHNETPSNRELSGIFGLHLHHRTERNAFNFQVQKLDLPVVRTSTELREFLQHFPNDIVIAESARADVSGRVMAIYRNALLRSHPVPTTADICRILGISEATLRRRMFAGRLSLRDLKDRVRIEFAQRYLAQGSSKIDGIAQQLDYSCGRAFARAFRRCTGVSPAGFRQGIADCSRKLAAQS